MTPYGVLKIFPFSKSFPIPNCSREAIAQDLTKMVGWVMFYQCIISLHYWFQIIFVFLLHRKRPWSSWPWPCHCHTQQNVHQPGMYTGKNAATGKSENGETYRCARFRFTCLTHSSRFVILVCTFVFYVILSHQEPWRSMGIEGKICRGRGKATVRKIK